MIKKNGDNFDGDYAGGDSRDFGLYADDREADGGGHVEVDGDYVVETVKKERLFGGMEFSKETRGFLDRLSDTQAARFSRALDLIEDGFEGADKSDSVAYLESLRDALEVFDTIENFEKLPDDLRIDFRIVLDDYKKALHGSDFLKKMFLVRYYPIREFSSSNERINDKKIIAKFFDKLGESIDRFLGRSRFCSGVKRDLEMGDDVSDYSDELKTEIKRVLLEIGGDNVPDVLAEFPVELHDLILGSVGIMELDVGCSVQCPFCAFNASKHVRGGEMKFEDLIWYSGRVDGSNILPYYATDALDYRTVDSNGVLRDYYDVSVVLGGREVVTAFPYHATDVLLKAGHKINGYSIIKANRRRFEAAGVVEFLDNDVVLPLTDEAIDKMFDIKGCSFSLRDQIHSNELIGAGRNFGEWGEGTGHDKVIDFYAMLNMLGDDRGEIEDKAAGFDSTIACVQCVAVSPKRIWNTVASLVSDKYKNGVIDVDLDPEKLMRGAEFITRYLNDFSSGKDVFVEDLLAYGCVENTSIIGDAPIVLLNEIGMFWFKVHGDDRRFFVRYDAKLGKVLHIE